MTGKKWPRLYEVELVHHERPPTAKQIEMTRRKCIKGYRPYHAGKKGDGATAG